MITKPGVLKVRYPYQFTGPAISMSFSRGWFSIFAQLCEDIENALGEDKRGFHWTQVKEKFGAARVYFQLSNGIHDREPELWNALMDLKVAAEVASSKVCAACGQPGTIDLGAGWMLALCAPHRVQQLAGTLPSIWLSDQQEGS